MTILKTMNRQTISRVSKPPFFIPVSTAEQFLLPSRLVFRTLRDSPIANWSQCYGHVSQSVLQLVRRRSKVDIVQGWPVRSGLSMLGRHLRTKSGNVSRCFKQKLPVFSKTLSKIHKIQSFQKVGQK